MFVKPLFTFILALASLGAISSEYKHYSNTQLQQEYNRLYNQNVTAVRELATTIRELRQEAVGEEIGAHQFIIYFSALVFADINKNYSINNYTYRQDPRVLSFVNLTDVCYQLTVRNNNVAPNNACEATNVLYMVAKYNRQTLQSLALAGVVFMAVLQQENNMPITQKQRALINLSKNPDAYNYGFKPYLPESADYLDNQTLYDFYTTFNVRLVRD